MKNHTEATEESVSSLVAYYSQVRKIKRELEKPNHLAVIEQSEMRSVLREFSKSQKHFRSSLGISDRPRLMAMAAREEAAGGGRDIIRLSWCNRRCNNDILDMCQNTTSSPANDDLGVPLPTITTFQICDEWWRLRRTGLGFPDLQMRSLTMRV
ncbi:unnamed protein product [Lactuca virosa]|uniref:Uncharacterized protein n=1 Tax=Lactuca virosa TaxID=75947 RepID=A0AAU9MJN2_9ASTR|nr:unnamed protein product [Lactuca virosa]